MTRWLKTLGLFVGLSALCLGAAFIMLYFIGDGTVEGNKLAIQEIGGTLDIIRWSGIIILVVVWPWLAEWMARQRDWDPEAVAVVKSFRWRLLFWLLMIELFVVQGILGKIMGWLFA